MSLGFQAESKALRQIDLNCDMGESYGAYRIGEDDALLEVVSSANIACGFHGGDPLVMDATMRRAQKSGVGIGAHPSFYDLWGFGRRVFVGEAPQDVGKAVIYQIGAAQAMARVAGAEVRHVKLHGALANLAFVHNDLAWGVVEAIAGVDPELMLVVMPGSALERAGEVSGLPIVREVYADRTYDDHGNLLSRKMAGAVLNDPEMIADRALAMIETRAIKCASGTAIEIGSIDSICIHGDTPGAASIARHLRRHLEGAGLAIKPMVAERAAIRQ